MDERVRDTWRDLIDRLRLCGAEWSCTKYSVHEHDMYRTTPAGVLSARIIAARATSELRRVAFARGTDYILRGWEVRVSHPERVREMGTAFLVAVDPVGGEHDLMTLADMRLSTP